MQCQCTSFLERQPWPANIRLSNGDDDRLWKTSNPRPLQWNALIWIAWSPRFTEIIPSIHCRTIESGRYLQFQSFELQRVTRVLILSGSDEYLSLGKNWDACIVFPRKITPHLISGEVGLTRKNWLYDERRKKNNFSLPSIFRSG